MATGLSIYVFSVLPEHHILSCLSTAISDPVADPADGGFIRQEAEEKAYEISVSAKEEFNIGKLQLVEAEKKKIRQEYERKQKQVEVRKNIIDLHQMLHILQWRGQRTSGVGGKDL